MAHYYKTEARETWCEVCGEFVSCEVFAAEYPEQETGYINERAICGDCRPERGGEKLMKPEFVPRCLPLTVSNAMASRRDSLAARPSQPCQQTPRAKRPQSSR